MLSFFAFWRELFLLIRNAPDNPLITHELPWKRGKFMALFAGAQFLSAFLFIGISAWLTIKAFLGKMLHGNWWSDDALVVYLLATGGTVIVLCPLNLLAWSWRWGQKDRVEELMLTPLNRRQMAFGSVFWGAMVSLIVPLAVMLSAFFHLFMRFLSRLEAASISLRELERAFRAFSDELLLMTFAFCMIPIALGTTIKVWFHLPRHRWVILLLAPALSLGGFIAGVLSVLILVELLDVNLPHWLDPLLAIPLLVWGVAMLRSSGKLAPSLFMRAVDSESYVRQSVIANQTIRFYRKELRAPVREALRKFVPIPWRGCARGAIIAAFVLLGLALAEFIVFPESISLWHSIMRLESALLLLLVASAVMLHSRNYSITLVSGSTMGSLFRTFWPLVLLGAGFIAVGGFGDIFMEYRSDYLAVTIVVSAFILCLAVILFAAGYLLLMAFILGSRKHRKLWAWLLVTLALLVHLEMHFNRAIIKPREWAEWSHVDYSYVKAPPGFWDVDVHTDYALAGLGLIAVLLLWNSIGILQRLYQNHLLGTTIGQARSQSGES